ncbi:MAG: efflux RND transporter periplasmic adaptor subunit [Pseudomonadales bacterium]|nr:efflux RND transporter periplasmic adaptor subunit [Pseudomonadales bacterium]
MNLAIRYQLITPSLLMLVLMLIGNNQASADDLDCLVVPGEVVDIGTPTTGLLSDIPVARGDIVKRGQVIAALSSGVERTSLALARERAENQTELDQSEASLNFLQHQEGRLAELYRNKTVSKESLDRAEMDRILAEHAVKKALANRKLAQLDQARTEELLNQRTIISPISGVVMQRALNVGEYVNETSYVMKIAQIDPLHVEVFVPLEMYQQVKVGMQADITLKAPLNGSYQAEIIVVDYVMDAASSTFGVQLNLANPDHSIPTGVKCTVNFLAPDRVVGTVSQPD